MNAYIHYVAMVRPIEGELECNIRSVNDIRTLAPILEQLYSLVIHLFPNIKYT